MQDGLNWNDFRYFLELSRQGRLLTAAKKMGVNHSTVSRRLAALEEALQIKLFEQDEYGYHLTEAGESLLPLARQMENASELTKEKVKLANQSLSGHLRVGAPDGFGNAFLAERIVGFTREHPQLKIKLVPIPYPHNLIKRDVDVAISLEPTGRQEILCKKVTDYKLYLYTSRAFLQENQVDLQDIKAIVKQPFTGYIPDILYTEQLNFNHKIDANIVECFQGSTVLSQYKFVAAGGGFGILPHFMARDNPALVPVLADQISFTRNYWLLIPIELHRLASVRSFEKALMAMIQDNKSLFLPGIPQGVAP